jgi:AraC-like DNA-binding protein
VRQLFGVPVAAIGTSVIALDELMGDLAGELWERSWSAGSWVERFAVVDEVFGRLRARHDGSARATVRPELRWVWHQVVGSGGAVRVDELADELGWSRRHLADRFRAEFGVSVSTLRRLARFEAAVELLRDPRPRRLADVAATVGYADQAHLSREFRRLAGRSITEWWTEEQFPFVHDDELGAA